MSFRVTRPSQQQTEQRVIDETKLKIDFVERYDCAHVAKKLIRSKVFETDLENYPQIADSMR
jgi:hypothetical protein